MHAGWAAQSGLRAALLARAGFTGPRTVFEGVHGLFNGFAHTREGNYGALLDGFGERWLTQTLAFKPYPCGTMVQPYIDCALRLRRAASRPTTSPRSLCEVGEGTVHRLWEPLADKQRPPNGYAGQVRHALLHRRRLPRRQPRPRRLHRRRRRRPARARARRQGALPDRSRPIPTRGLHRPHPRHAARRPRHRGAPAAPARRRQRAAHPRRAGGQVRRSTPAPAAGPTPRLAAALALARTLFDGAVDLGAWRG